MPQGLLIWDALGTLKLDITDRLTRLDSSYSFTISAGAYHTTISVPNIAPDGTWYVVSTAGAWFGDSFATPTWTAINYGYVDVYCRATSTTTVYGSMHVFRV